MSKENKMGKEKSFGILDADFTLRKSIEEYRSKLSQAFSSSDSIAGESTMSKPKSFEIGKAHFTLDKPIEKFDSNYFQASGSSQAILSYSSDELMIRRLSWIHEEDNREEDSSSFSGLDLFSPQLVQPTRNRPPPSRIHRPAKQVTATTSTEEITTQFSGLEARETADVGKKPLRNSNTNCQ
nr:uncharacterized protein LOC131793770 [Pocillopora verrucosa]